MRELPFVHQIHQPDAPDGSVMVLLHGTGGNETDLMPLAHRIAPNATLLGVRGRSNEEGVSRFFRRKSMTTFDQADIRSESEAFAAFWQDALAAYHLDPKQVTVMGYSNGANFAGAMMALYPDLIRRAILIRAMPVLEDLPKVNLQGARVLTLTGARDPYGPFAEAFNIWLKVSGAELDAQVVNAGHEIDPEDLTRATAWMKGH